MRQLRILRRISSLPKTEPVVELVPLNDKTKETLLEGILKNHKKVGIIQDKAFLGCSLGTIAACVGVSPQTFSNWAYRGREDCLKYDPEFTLTPHMKLWKYLQEGYSQARILAETSLAQKNPELFLKSKTSQLLGDDWVESKISSEEEETKTRLDVGANLIASLKLARRQGLDINSILDLDLLTIKTEAPKEKEQDLLTSNGVLSNVFPSLPSSLATNIET
jgi:hypothetical protein